MSNRLTNILAVLLLIFVFAITVFSMEDDSLTMDELAHLPAGYSYLTQKDMRLNPEHPPLIKDLAAIPLLFIKNIHFPSDIKAWTDDINGQWDFGNNFLFHSQNPADEMIFWGRIPMILVLILLGFYIFKWARELFGNKASLLALFLFSFSPTFLTHGRLVTTDVGAAAGIFIATYYFIRALQKPVMKNIVFAGIAFGLAELCKFTVILLLPFFILLGLTWWMFKSKKLLETLKVLILVFVIGYLLVWPVYLYHTWNYPQEKQARDIAFLMTSHPIKFLGPMLVEMTKISVLRPYAQYLFGLSLVYQRGTGGNTGYFLGEVSASGWKDYFPIVYLIKEPLPFHILTLIALISVLWSIRKFWQRTFGRFKNWVGLHFVEFSMLIFILIYWVFSLTSNLNIGVRHLLPLFPFTMVLVAAITTKWLKPPFSKVKYVFLAILVLWQITSIARVYPSFLSYCNQLAGGPNQCSFYVVDSNLDWGQDLKRLAKWAEDNKIDKIFVDYFGGADIQYYLKEKFVPWWGTKNPNEFPKKNYLAVSTTFLQGGRGKPVAGFTQNFGYYNWLDKYTPIAKIGYSIFVYYIP